LLHFNTNKIAFADQHLYLIDFVVFTVDDYQYNWYKLLQVYYTKLLLLTPPSQISTLIDRLSLLRLSLYYVMANYSLTHSLTHSQSSLIYSFNHSPPHSLT